MLQNAMGDLPTLASTNYTTTTANPNMLLGLTHHQNQYLSEQIKKEQDKKAFQYTQNQGEVIHMTIPIRRLVKVVIVDPNDNIPLDQCVLYNGDEKVTDATDQELFFEIDIKDVLAKHNDKRVKVVDKKVKERTEYLEPAKIRDLKMVVVNIAQF